MSSQQKTKTRTRSRSKSKKGGRNSKNYSKGNAEHILLENNAKLNVIHRDVQDQTNLIEQMNRKISLVQDLVKLMSNSPAASLPPME